MKSISSYDSLEKFGKIRLSKHFFMREFLYSEIANHYGVRNAPDFPEKAESVGRKLCEELLEPLNATFGRIVIRSAYRSPAVNELGNQKGLNCASNEKNFAGHIWDYPDSDGCYGATACIVIPWFADRYAQGADWRSLAYWIHDHLPYSEMEFFDSNGMCSFNLSWHEKPKKNITSWLKPRTLIKNGHTEHGFNEWYENFPKLENHQRIANQS
jgi:hypothetical protein